MSVHYPDSTYLLPTDTMRSPLALTALAVFISVLLFISAAPLETTFRVAPYLQFGTKHSMVVLWETEEPATTRVEYGESRMGDDAPNLSLHKELDGTRTMHEVVLEGLKPETKYFWRVVSKLESGEEIVSEHSSFKTNVHDSTAFSFVFYSDSQNNPDVWGKVSTLGWLERPNFAIHAGDLVDRGGHMPDWLIDFFPPANDLMRRVPMYTILGNHEDDDANYYRYFHNPAPEYYYSFKYGNAEFFLVDTNRPVTEDSEQYKWLEQQLAGSTATWKFVVHHHPPYSSEENDHGDSWVGSTSLGTHARNLVPLYEHYGVDLCLFGHVHMYERTWPLLEGGVNQKNGVVYINGGGAGGGLEQFAPTRSWFTAKVKSTHHYGYFAIHDNMLIFQAIDQEGNMFDSFQLEKSDERLAQSHVVKPPPPQFENETRLFLGSTEVAFNAPFEGVDIRYTTDGSAPSSSSPKYSAPFTLDASTTIKVASFTKEGMRSRVMTRAFEKASLQKATKVSRPKKGLRYAYYEGGWSKLPDFSSLEPVKEDVTESIGIEGNADKEDQIGLVFEGYVEVEKDGIYTAYTESDDGSRLYINGEMVVDNDGLHGRQTRNGQVALAKGYHQVRIEFFENSGGEYLKASLIGEGFPKELLSAGSLFHK